MKKLLRLFFPLSLRVRFLLATAAVVLVLSLAYGMVALIGYSVSFDKNYVSAVTWREQSVLYPCEVGKQ